MIFKDKSMIIVKGIQYIKKEIIIQILLEAKKEKVDIDFLIESFLNLKAIN